jgi:hypothetical protein
MRAENYHALHVTIPIRNTCKSPKNTELQNFHPMRTGVIMRGWLVHRVHGVSLAKLTGCTCSVMYLKQGG